MRGTKQHNTMRLISIHIHIRTFLTSGIDMICLFSCLLPVLVKCGLAAELVIIPFLSCHVLASVCRVFATAQHLDFLLQCLTVSIPCNS